MNIHMNYMPNNEIEIHMPIELQSKEYADEYLKIQELCNVSCSKISVYFEGTLWIDNLAMMQLFLLLFKLKKMGKEIFFYFEVDVDVTEQVRFIKYIEDYGFLDIMEMLSESFERENVRKFYSGWGYRMIPEGDFESSECLMPFSIITEREKISECIDDVVERFESVLGNLFSEYEKEDLVFRMSIFLQETISNAFEHAFDNAEDAFCGVMIRYMHKIDKNIISRRKRDYFSLRNEPKASIAFRDVSFTYKNYLKVASAHNPYRNEVGMKVLENYMQIFVTDVGMGLLESMEISDCKKERNLLNEIFQKGTRSPKKVRNTLVGGLGMIYQLLQNSDNYISIKGEYNWAKIICANKNDSDGTLNYVHKNGAGEGEVLKGFSIIGYIDCDYEKKKEFFVTAPKEYIEEIYLEEYVLKDMDKIGNIDVVDFRMGIPDLSKITLDNNVVLCFAGQNTEKGIWTNRMLRFFKEKNKNLILVDIPEREIRKYELIFQGFKGEVDKAILLTNSSEVAVFISDSNNLLQFDKRETEEYKKSREKDITKSLYELLKVIRIYDSQQFWTVVSETQKTKEAQLFINALISWNLEEVDCMDGYLDFSQACFDEKIKNLLIYQLFRLPRTESKDNYFVSMDRFTEDLCENVNGKLKITFRGKENSNIQLGSVYVTGTSSKVSKLEQKRTDSDEYYYFRHSTADKENGTKIKALLLWPSKGLADKLFDKDELPEELKRLAKTPFVAPGGTSYFARQHYADIKKSIALKQDEFYSVLQEERLWTNRLIKIAHIDMVDHHDYMFFNAVTLFNKHYMESRFNEKYVQRNSFDYLLKEMYKTLGKSPRKSYAKSIEMDIRPQYRMIVEGKIMSSEVSTTQGLFVYLTDYETMEIVSKLKQIFSQEMQKRIIPIAPVSKKKGSSALLLSPVLMENIKSKLQKMEKDNAQVTIFIASVTSTRLQRELKHILSRLGAAKVQCLSLIDRQRFPLGSREHESYNSFCKLDLPHLHSERRCPMCLGISKITELRNDLISRNLQERCDEIAFIWGRAKISDNMYERGVQSRNYVFPKELKKNIDEICHQYQINTVEINTDVGLVLFSIENAAITMSVDFLMNCLKNENIEDTVKILMISAHLTLFSSEEIVPADKYFLAEYLCKLLQKQTESNEYTALACVTILIQKTNVKEKLYEYYEKNWKLKHFMNVDFMIASIGILNNVEKLKRDKILGYWLRKYQEEPLDFLYGIFLLTDGKDVTRHRTILADMREWGKQYSKMDYVSADNDATFLKMAYQNMPHSYFSKQEDYQEGRKEVISKIQQVRELLDKAIRTELNCTERQQLATRIIDMFRYTANFNKELFMCTKEDRLRELRSNLVNVAKKAEENKSNSAQCYIKAITYEPRTDIKYFYYLEDLQREILYLMLDFRHSDKNNPMIGEDGKRYDGIVEIKFEEEYMRYCFYNHVSNDFSVKEVERKKKLKYNRPTIVSLRMLFPEKEKTDLFRYVYDETRKVFMVELRIPYLIV